MHNRVAGESYVKVNICGRCPRIFNLNHEVDGYRSVLMIIKILESEVLLYEVGDA